MSAPKLLDKKTVNAEVAAQRTRSINEGVALAKKVDALRETLQDEQGNLEAFRSETLSRVQTEIDARIRERELIVIEISKAKEHLALLRQPLDAEWEGVAAARSYLKEYDLDLESKEIDVINRQRDLESLIKENKQEKQRITGLKSQAQQFLEDTESKSIQGSNTLERANREAKRKLEIVREIEARLKVREEEATAREVLLSKRETEVQTIVDDLEAREKKLKSRQELFLKSQNYLKIKK